MLVVTSDPLSVIPSIGMKESAWLSVHLLASDLTTSGVEPQFAMLDLNLPPEMELPAVGAYLKAIGDECRKLGIAIAGGHTGRYPGSGYTVVGGGTMFSVAGRDAYVTPAMAKPGDAVLITKGAAIGATAVLAHSFPETIEKKAGAAMLGKAKSRLRDCSTVKDARSAASVGLRENVTSMHDATEGGVLGGLFELSSACGLPVVVRREAIHVPEEASAVCGAFGLDPLTTLSEGTLIVTCRPEAVEGLRAALAKARDRELRDRARRPAGPGEGPLGLLGRLEAAGARPGARTATGRPMRTRVARQQGVEGSRTYELLAAEPLPLLRRWAFSWSPRPASISSSSSSSSA